MDQVPIIDNSNKTKMSVNNGNSTYDSKKDCLRGICKSHLEGNSLRILNTRLKSIMLNQKEECIGELAVPLFNALFEVIKKGCLCNNPNNLLK